ncbi:hypothetical protein GCM10011352_18950 [Marinobacterium zhoushanense]|uniref:DUF6455 domain-containing protein n=1 Tax=Marinobacterium zhoushanense TaxID=1679163 RepID=A0ABQ1KAU0_9GAMM|nr:DUF6455 family protein [Marinobacterium zhoushanense]GGB93116.1 hypothetical protein GCM10011352_18950 [Marinobacterium zhoushanense]
MGLMQFLENRMDMMSGMLAASGADLSRLPHSSFEQQFRTATFRCLNCKNCQDCERWLSEGHLQQKVPGFCPNAELMNSVRD